MGQFLSCDLLHSGLHFGDFHEVRLCCHLPGKTVISEDFRRDGINAEAIRCLRTRLESDLNSGRPTQCDGCGYLYRREWPNSGYLVDKVALSVSTGCNINCGYCTQTGMRKGTSAACDEYDFERMFSELLRPGVLNPAGHVVVSSGEPFLIPGLIRLLEDVLEKTELTIWPAGLERLIGTGRVQICFSLDAGCRETYRLVKRRDCFDAVMENMRRILAIDPWKLLVKYVCITDNATASERERFLSLVDDYGVKSIIISTDVTDGITPERSAFLGEFKYFADMGGCVAYVQYASFDLFFAGMSHRENIERAYRGKLAEKYSYLDDISLPMPDAGRIETLEKDNEGGLQVGGWVYDRELKRCPERLVFSFEDMPVIGGRCKYIRSGLGNGDEMAGFGMLSGDRKLAAAVMGNPERCALHALFGDGTWLRIPAVR